MFWVHRGKSPGSDSEVAAAPQVSILTYEQLADAKSLLEVKGLYQAQGIIVEDQKQLLEMVKKDWKIEAAGHFAKVYSSAHVLEQFPTLSISVAGKPLKLFGVTHDIRADPTMFALLMTDLRSHPFQLAEQNLGASSIFPLAPRARELQDHYIDGIVASAFNGLLKGVASSFENLRIKIATRGRNNDNDHLSQRITLSDPNSEIIRDQLAAVLTTNKAQDPLLAVFSLLNLLIDPELFKEMPTNLSLENKLQTGARLTNSERRSYYMAEFLREFDLPKLLKEHGATESDIERTKELAYICGAAHVKEIQYFLEHPTHFNRIRNRAVKDARRLLENPRRYDVFCNMNRVAESVAAAAITLSAGATLGLIVERLLLKR